MSELRVIALFYINYVNDGDACLTSHYSIISLRVGVLMEKCLEKGSVWRGGLGFTV